MRMIIAYEQSKEQIGGNSPAEVAAINAPLIVSSRGKTLTRSGLDSAMQRLKRKMKEMQLDHVFWTLPDLERKGMSDAQDDRIAGHKSDQMRERYKVKIERRKPARKSICSFSGTVQEQMSDLAKARLFPND